MRHPWNQCRACDSQTPLRVVQGIVTAAPALPQIPFQYNVLQDITCEQFPVQDGMLQMLCKLRHPIGDNEFKNTPDERRGTGRNGP